MGRKDDVSSVDVLFDLLSIAPSWFGPVLAACAFTLLRFVIPLFLHPNKTAAFDATPVVLAFLPGIAWIAGTLILIAWVGVEIGKGLDRRRLDRQTGLASIRELGWQEFERLVSEAYRRRGYTATVVGSSSGDGGVDVELIRPGEKVLVQCKQWRVYQVGVKTVRELLGVVVGEGATRGILVTSGRFTQEARRFSSANSKIELVDGLLLAELLRSVQSEKKGSAPTVPVAATPQAPICRDCGCAMVLRTARRGSYAGSTFWGCPRYPKCRQTVDVV